MADNIKQMIQAEILDPRGLSARALSMELKRDEGFIWALMRGRNRISPPVAQILEDLSGTPALTWLYHHPDVNQ